MANKSLTGIGLLLMYVLVVAITTSFSGCTTSSGGGGDAGLEITDYTIEPQQIYADEGVNIYLTIQNVGSKDMPGDSYLWVYGPDFVNEWQMEGELSDAVSGGYRIPTDQLLVGDQISLAGDAEYKGSVPQGNVKQYQFYARLCYPYVTTFTGDFYLVSRDEAIAEKKEGQIYDTLSSGPIGIDLVRKNRVITARATQKSINITGNPIRGTISGQGSVNVGNVGVNVQVSFETGENGGNVPVVYLPFEITNRGDGFPTVPSRCTYGPDVSTQNRDKVAVSVSLDGRDITSMCGNAGDHTTIQLDMSNGHRETRTVDIVSLRGGRGYLSCRVRDLDFSVPKKQYNFEVDAYYEYYTTKEQDVVVKSVKDIR